MRRIQPTARPSATMHPAAPAADWLAPFVLLLALTGLAACATSATREASETQPARPDIVLILFDDLGFSDLGAYGGELDTPNIDALAASGVTVSQFYNHAKCSPTRASLLTGLSPHQAGIRNAVSRPTRARPPGPNQGYLEPSAVTLAEGLRAAGYGTYMSGKWHVGEARPHWPVEHGFDRYWGLISGASSFFEIIDEPRQRTMALDGEPWLPPETGFYMTTETGDRAEGFVRDHLASRPDAPLFLYVSFTAPHWPLHALREDIAAMDGRFDAGWDELAQQRLKRLQQRRLLPPAVHELPPRPLTVPAWSEADDKEDWTRRMEVYGAMMRSADREVGDLIALLEAEGRLDNTLILVLSDNGASAEDVQAERGLGEPGVSIGLRGSYDSYLEPWARLSNAPFADYKTTLMEGGIRTPFIAHWPAGIDAPGRIETTGWGTVTDIAPTVFDLAGLDPASLAVQAGAPALGGISLAEWLSFGADMTDRPPHFWEYNGWAAIRHGNWKAVRPPGSNWQLFDLANDPTEQADLAADQPSRLSELIAAWQAWADRVGAAD